MTETRITVFAVILGISLFGLWGLTNGDAFALAFIGDDESIDPIDIDLEKTYLGSQDDNAWFAVYPDNVREIDGYLKIIITKGGHIEHIEMPTAYGHSGIIVWALCELPESE